MKCAEQIPGHHQRDSQIPDFCIAAGLKAPSGYFRFGSDVICYGETSGETRPSVENDLLDASQFVFRNGQSVTLPFDPDQVLDNLRYERYVSAAGPEKGIVRSWVGTLYYLVRPLLPVQVRKHLQRAYIRRRESGVFPGWPVDRSVDILLEKLLVLSMQSSQTSRTPFIWFWPDGYRACAIMTHDVETKAGRNFCGALMDLNDSFGIKSSFQIVPEDRYSVPSDYLQAIRSRGFEVNIHGLNHKGNLFETRERFLRDARKINEYAELFGARGFRSPVLYRNVDWFQDLNFSYDMSFPNVARLEAQQGGCCTVLPYFLPGGMLELPLTITEDYSLFHILTDYSTKLWEQQMNIILKGNGLMNFLVHPDYVIANRARDVYKALLEEICQLRSSRGLWVALPGEVERWWRERSEMRLIPDGLGWKIEGAGSKRAVVAYACLDGERLVYEFDAGTNSEGGPAPPVKAAQSSG
jgi:peptidoglycan/xylan/chitin deacetylase (PgdA/CDA1 family)